MRGFVADQITLAAIAIGVVFGAGLLYWGNRFKTMRRTTIILYGILGGGLLVAAGLVVNHSAGSAVVVPSRPSSPPAACSSWPARRPRRSACSPTSRERFPADRGAIMGLYSVFLAIGQIIGSLIGGFAADWRGHRRHAPRDVRPARGRAHPAVAAARQEHDIDRLGTAVRR